MRPPLVLGIETSCDDTACAVVDGAGRVLASVVSSQLAVHRPYGGVVPELASREQLANWPAVYEETLARAGVTIDDIGAIAATSGPGLIGSLLVGLSLGRAMAWSRGLPFSRRPPSRRSSLLALAHHRRQPGGALSRALRRAGRLGRAHQPLRRRAGECERGDAPRRDPRRRLRRGVRQVRQAPGAALSAGAAARPAGGARRRRRGTGRPARRHGGALLLLLGVEDAGGPRARAARGEGPPHAADRRCSARRRTARPSTRFPSRSSISPPASATRRCARSSTASPASTAARRSPTSRSRAVRRPTGCCAGGFRNGRPSAR